MYLAGDIGGTKTHLAIYDPEKGARDPLAESKFPSSEYDSLIAVVKDFYAQSGLRAQQASFGVAGPVVDGKIDVTNLPWSISESQLEAELGLEKASLINDLYSVANAVPHLQPEDLHVLQAGEEVARAPKVVIAPGTGLGEAFLAWGGERYVSFASEGGHADFAPNNTLEVDLLAYLQKIFGHVSYERIISGIGVPNIYNFLKDSGRASEPDSLKGVIAAADDPTPVIMTAAVSEAPPEICRQTLDVFVSILGAEAGNMALNTMAAGGVYLGGGMPPRILDALDDGAFLSAFHAKGRFTELMKSMPVYVILNPNVALLGAAHHVFGE
jgi:glucokinase